MKRLLILLFLMVITVISGCVGQSGGGGGPGVIITDFSVDYSPITAGETVGLSLEVQNQGEHETTVDIVEYFGVSGWGLPTTTSKSWNLAAADPTTGFEGGTQAESITITAPSGIASKTSFDLGVRVEYPYVTHFTATMRVVEQDYLRTISKSERERMIESGGIRQSDSTIAPLSVSTASGSHFIAGPDKSVIIPFRVTNAGPGFPYTGTDAETAAAATPSTLYQVTVVDLDGADNLNCGGVGTITLSRGKNGGFGCTLTIPETVNNFADYTFSVGLSYRYYVDGSASITVEPPYGGVTTI